MDRDQREELRHWAGRLARAGTTPDSKAAGKAIDLLVEEVDRLERELARARTELEERAEVERRRARREAERADAERQRARDEAERADAERQRARDEAEHIRRRQERERRDSEPRLVAVPAAVGETAPPWSALDDLPGSSLAEELGIEIPDVLPADLVAPVERPRRAPRPRRRRRRGPVLRFPRPGRRTMAAVAGTALVAASAAAAARIVAPELAAAGPSSGALIGAAAAEQLVFSIAATPETLGRMRWTIDGEDVTERASLAAGRSLLRGSHLADGLHTIEAFAEGRFPGTSTRRVWQLSIDRTPPEVVVDPATAKGPPARPLTLKGRVEDGATLKANGADVEVEGGAFELRLPEPPPKPIAFVATDRHGNTATTSVAVELVPRLPRDPIRSVHVTFHAWANDELRSGIMRLIDEGRINSVQLDLKDESGIVGFDADVPFAKQIGAVEEIYDLEQAVRVLHAKGIYVIGRIVAFRDPVHAQAAWRRGWRNQVVQTPGGALYAGYGGFTNFANPVVRRYNIDVAKRAAELGVDDILYDYVRRPDGPPAAMRFPQLKGTAEASIASFLRQARGQLKRYDVFLGAAVFGVAATRPHEVAQDIPAMARNSDYIAPMLYPSHWGPGEYDVENPNAQPYDIVLASLKDFREQTAGTGARVVPWLQDFSMGHAYGSAEVRTQIEAARDAGIEEWILWDPLVTYTADALDPMPRPAPIETRTVEP